jgi:hypothetical protein
MTNAAHPKRRTTTSDLGNLAAFFILSTSWLMMI